MVEELQEIEPEDDKEAGGVWVPVKGQTVPGLFGGVYYDAQRKFLEIMTLLLLNESTTFVFLTLANESLERTKHLLHLLLKKLKNSPPQVK